jgi:hypothetical protein
MSCAANVLASNSDIGNLPELPPRNVKPPGMRKKEWRKIAGTGNPDIFPAGYELMQSKTRFFTGRSYAHYKLAY